MYNVDNSRKYGGLPETGLLVAAYNSDTNKEETVDIIYLDKISALRFCRAEGVEKVLMHLLKHY